MLKHLLNFWLAPMFGLFFAAGAVADLGGGDGASNADGNAGDSGADSSGGNGDNAAGTGEGTSDQSASEPGSEAADQNALIDSGDGRRIPQKYAELFKTDKALKEIFFSAQALKREFPGGVREAVELKKGIDELGGMDGIQQLKSDLDLHNQDAQLFESDPAKWAEQGFTENPESALKAFAHSLEYVAEHHPEQYDYLGSKIVLNTLDQGPVHDLYNFLAGLKDNAQAQEMAKALAKFYNGIKNTASKVPEKQVSAQEKALTEREGKLTQKEQEIRNKAINTEATPYMTKAIESTLDKVAKENGFDLAKLRKDQPNRYGRFLKDVRNTVHSNVLGDDKWLSRYSQALASNDTAKCVRMLNARHDQAIQGNGTQSGVVKGVFEEWFGTGKPKPVVNTNTRTNQPTKIGNETPMLVNSLPPAKDINYSDPKTDKWEGIYRLKTGKLIQVKRA